MVFTVDEFLVTIQLRVAVSDRQALLRKWQDGDPRLADSLSGEPDLALQLAVQSAVKPPDLADVTGLALPHSQSMVASVKAEAWREDLDPW